MENPTGKIITPHQEVYQLKAHAVDRGLSEFELKSIEGLGNDGYGIQAQLEQLYAWLESHPASAKERGIAHA